MNLFIVYSLVYMVRSYINKEIFAYLFSVFLSLLDLQFSFHLCIVCFQSLLIKKLQILIYLRRGNRKKMVTYHEDYEENIVIISNN